LFVFVIWRYKNTKKSSNGNGYLSEKQINNHFFCQKNIEMECRKQLCEKMQKERG